MAYQLPEPSAHARKYGPWNQNPNISGLTPLPPLFPKSKIDPEELATRKKIEKFQRDNLLGFTARILADLDVISDRELKDSTLDNPIMPMLRQNRWEFKPCEPQFTRNYMYPLIIDEQSYGEWSMYNPLVYEKMKPVLQLATRTLSSMYTLPWFGALLFGNRFAVEQRRIRPGDFDKISKNTTSFHPRNIHPQIVQQRMEKVFYDLEHLWGLKFGFMAPYEDPRGPENDFHTDTNDGDDENNHEWKSPPVGLCTTNYSQMKYGQENIKVWGIWIFLNFKQAEPLFRNDLTSAERKMVEWAIAVTIVHETIHAITNIAPSGLDTVLEYLEDDTPPPFFDDEALAEVGFSFEAALNGGTCRPFLEVESGLPYGHWFETIWPAVDGQEFCSSESITLMNPGPFSYQERFPIPVSFYEDIQQTNFWDDLVKRYGHKLFHFRGLQQGSRTNYTVQESTPTPILFESTTAKRLKSPSASIDLISNILKERILIANTLSNAQGLTQAHREAELLAKLLLKSSTREDQFWHQIWQQSRSINLIFEQMQRKNQSRQEQIESLEQLIELVSTIVRNHGRTIDDLLETVSPAEEEFIVPSKQRKKVLLSWNRGTNIFISEFKKQEMVKRNQSYLGRLVEESINLEVCRMRLFTPELTPEAQSAPIDFHEYVQLIKLRDSLTEPRSIPQCYDFCSQLLAIEGCSLFPALCVNFTLLGLYSGSELTRERTLQIHQMKQETEVFYKLKASAPGPWRPLFGFWEVVMSGVMNNVARFHDM